MPFHPVDNTSPIFFPVLRGGGRLMTLGTNALKFYAPLFAGVNITKTDLFEGVLTQIGKHDLAIVVVGCFKITVILFCLYHAPVHDPVNFRPLPQGVHTRAGQIMTLVAILGH